MQIKLGTPTEEAAFYRLLLEVLLALSKIPVKSSTDTKAVDNIERILYSVQ